MSVHCFFDVHEIADPDKLAEHRFLREFRSAEPSLKAINPAADLRALYKLRLSPRACVLPNRWQRRGGSIVAILRFLMPAVAAYPLVTLPAEAVDLDEMTVVTLARDGSWGVAMAGSQGQAIAAAVGACRAKAAAPSDCGAQFMTTRGGWVVATLCGDHKIIVAAGTREATEQAARAREIELGRSHAAHLPPCRRVLTVDWRGAVVITGVPDSGLTHGPGCETAVLKRRAANHGEGNQCDRTHDNSQRR